MDIRDMRVLLHICCAPCSVYTIKEFRGEGADLSGYFYNPNIHPYTEFSKRLETLKEYAKIMLLPLDVDAAYDLEPFLSGALALGKDRCLFCYRMRLEKTFQKAARDNFDGVSTTLLYSRHQRHDDIRTIGERTLQDIRCPFPVSRSEERLAGRYRRIKEAQHVPPAVLRVHIQRKGALRREMMPSIGKMLVVIGIVLIVLGLASMYGPKIPWLGKLPGDISIKKDNFTFYFPIATSIIISIILSILFSIFRK